jgi:DivIVA domain-containing protein
MLKIGLAAGNAQRNTAHVVEREPDRAGEAGGERQEPELPPVRASSFRGTVPEDLRNVSFHSGVRGYDRREVDRYVQRVNRAIAELEVASSPQSAVRHALEKVGEQTSGVLQSARETADEIVRTARSEAEEMVARGRDDTLEIIARARAEAAQIVADAEAEARERIERIERECAALQKQGEDALAAATATAARAKSEGADIVARATTEAEEIIVRADTQAVEQRAREEERAAQLRSQVEEEIRSLRGDVEAIDAERRRALGEVEGLAKRLEQLAATGKIPESVPDGGPEDNAAEAQPPSTEDAAASAVSGSGAANPPTPSLPTTPEIVQPKPL